MSKSKDKKDKEPKTESRKRKASEKSAASNEKKTKKARKDTDESPAAGTFLSIAKTTVNPTLASLFSNSANVEVNPSLQTRSRFVEANARPKHVALIGEDESIADAGDDEVDDEILSELGSDKESLDDSSEPEDVAVPEPATKRRRKANDEDEDLETKYLTKLSKEAAKDALKSRQSDPTITQDANEASDDLEDEDEDLEEDDELDTDAEDPKMLPPPQHETIVPEGTEEMDKAQRTVFLGNVSTTAITSKTALKTLNTHLISFFSALPAAQSTDPPRALSSLRFRSTPFASAIPKRAAFAKKEIMEATTHSTNAYAVYSSPNLAREACKRLNGTIILDRHLRVDSVAHPAKVDHKRCIFVGNLGFVDDETNIDAANAESGREQRKGKKFPSDVEEGLWRTFSKCGTVESVRVVRDAKTRVGKGFAYVQFTDENAVEAALQYNEKRFPPMLPRKLRVVRAKPVKRNQTAQRLAREQQGGSKRGAGYVKKLTPQEQSQMGRAAKLLGKSAAGQMRHGGNSSAGAGATKPSMKTPESFVFEGHRAKSGSKPGLKQMKGQGKKAKPTKNSTKRAAAWKQKQAK